MSNMVEKSKVFSFSAAGHDKIWLEGFKERLGEASFSKAVIDGLKLLDCKENKISTECKKLGLNPDAILAGFVQSHRVSNDPTSDQSLDFFEKMEINRNA